jgi:hypothetical protein
VFIAFFPPHSETSHRFRSLDQEGGRWLQMLRVGVQAMAPLQHRFLRQPNFPRQLGARLSLEHPAQDQHDMHRCKLTAREDGATIKMIHALTPLTAVDRQATPAICAKEAGFGVCRLAVRALEPSGMEVLFQPSTPLIIIEEVYDRKIMRSIVPILHYLYS